MTEYKKEDLESLTNDTNRKIIKFEDLLILCEERDLPISNETKKRVYSSYVNGRRYRNKEDDDVRITNLVFARVNKTKEKVEFDIITKNFDLIDTKWISI